MKKNKQILRCWLIVAVSIFVAACGGGGDGIDGTGQDEVMLSGTAAVGSPITNKIIQVKGKKGKTAQSTTDANGKFKVNVKALERPYILKIEGPDGKNIYSVASKPGTINLHPISDLMTRNLFANENIDIEAEFITTAPLSFVPIQARINEIFLSIEKLFVTAYQDFSVPTNFNYLTTEFDANQIAFDAMLDQLKISIEDEKFSINITEKTTNIVANIVINLNINVDLTQDDIEAPSKPSDFGAISSNQSSIVSVWNSSQDNVAVSGYYVYRDGAVTPTASVSSPVFIDDNLMSETEYCYVVSAYDSEGNESEKSESFCATTLTEPDINAPAIISAITTDAISTSAITISWAPAQETDVLGYHVYRQKEGEFVKVSTLLSSEYKDDSLNENTEYCYQVRAFDAALNISDVVNSFCATTQTTATNNDSNAPVTTISHSSGSYNSSIAVTLSCDDNNESGCSTIYYTFDDGVGLNQFQIYNDALSVSTDVTLRYYSTDNVGNTEIFKTNTFTIDSISPETSNSLSAGSYTTPQEVFLLCNDGEGSGCANIYYTLDGSLPDTNSSVYMGVINITSDTTLRYFSVDNAGNAEVENSIDYVINLIPLIVDVSVLSQPVKAGEKSYVAINVSNVSSLPINNIVMSYQVPEGMSFKDTYDVTPNPALCFTRTCLAGQDVIWTIGSLPKGGSKTININADIDAGQLSGVSLNAPIKITATELDEPIIAVHTLTIDNTPSAQLAVSANVDPVMPGETYQLTIDASNISGAPLTSAELRLTLPAGVTVEDTDGGVDSGTGELVWDLSASVVAVGEALRREVLLTAPTLPGTQSTDQLKARAQFTFDGGAEIDVIAEHTVTIVEVMSPLKFDISVAEQAVVAGNRVYYSLTVSNVSFLPLNNVILQYRVPKGIRFNDISDVTPNPALCFTRTCLAGQEVVWDIGTLPKGGSQTININASIDAGQLSGTLLSAPIRITANELDDTINLLHTLSIHDDPSAQLALSANVDPVMPGETYQLTVDASNISGAPLTGAELRLTLPAGVTVEDADGGVDSGTGELVWDLSTSVVAVGEALRREVLLTAPVLPGTQSTDQLKARAEFTFDGGAEVDVIAEHTVTVVEVMSPLKFDISVAEQPVVAGKRVYYSLTVSNVSFLPLYNVFVQYRVPKGVRFNDISDVTPNPELCFTRTCLAGQEVVWNIGSLPKGGSQTININASIDAGQLSGTLLTAPIHITANELDDTINLLHTLSIHNDPSAQLALSANVDPVMPGETYQLTVDASNISGAPLTGAELRLTLPAGVTVDDADGGVDSGTGELVWDLSASVIAVGEALRREVLLTAPTLPGTQSTDQLKARAQFTFDGGAEIDVIAEHTVSISNSDLLLPELWLTISSTPSQVEADSILVYELSVKNNSALPINDIRVIFIVPNGLTFNDTTDVTPNPELCFTRTCLAGQEVTWFYNTIDAGQSEIITIDASVASGLTNGTQLNVPVIATALELDDTISVINTVIINNP